MLSRSNFRPETFQFIRKFVTERNRAKTAYLLCLVGNNSWKKTHITG